MIHVNDRWAIEPGACDGWDAVLHFESGRVRQRYSFTRLDSAARYILDRSGGDATGLVELQDAIRAATAEIVAAVAKIGARDNNT